MKRKQLAGAIVSCLLVIGCMPVPVRQDSTSMQAAVAQSTAGAPRLPNPGENYLDPAWFEQTLTAERAVQAALLNNPRVRGELSRLDAAQAERVQAGLLRNPMTTLMALRPEGGGRYELDYNLMQSLFDLFTRSRRMQAANAAQQRIEAEVLVQLLALAQDSEAAYYDALAAQARLGLQRQQLALDEEYLLLLQRQASQGAVPASMVLDQEGMTATRAHEVQLAESELAQARSSLAQQLGLSSAAMLRLPDSLDPPEVPGLDGPTLQALAASHRPELRATQAGIDQARTELSLQSGTLRATDPSLGIAGVRETDGLWMNGLELQITIPVFDTGQARGDFARAQIAQAQAAAESIRRQVPLEVERALATLAAAQVA
nr:TolC family protein [Arenimonas sp.]